MAMDSRNMSAQQQAAALQQMRYMNNGPPHFSGNNGQQNGQQMTPGNPNVMNSQAMQRFQQMNARQMMSQMRPPSLMPANMKTTGMRFPSANQQQQQQQQVMNPGQASFNQANVQAQQIAAQMQQQQQSSNSSGGGGAKWHTPQQKQSNHGNGMSMMGMSMSPPAIPNPFVQDSFKIPLKSPDTLRNQMTSSNGSSNSSGSFPLPNVTSTNPKTPSPSQKDQQKDLDSIDSVCTDSVNDLLATIAKLDSNGVQVLPEGRNKATSPQVHSSTDAMDTAMNSAIISLTDKNNSQPKDDPNEDWCACCMDGGELMCCDKCPKVFHQACHIPVISSLPDESETWQCLLCYNFSDATPGKNKNLSFSL